MLKYTISQDNFATPQELAAEISTNNYSQITEAGLEGVLTRMCFSACTPATDKERLCMFNILQDYGHLFVTNETYYLSEYYVKKFGQN
jgi:hypothetical protein